MLSAFDWQPVFSFTYIQIHVMGHFEINGTLSVFSSSRRDHSFLMSALLVCRSAVAYLCGHLHTLGGLMPVLHSRHPQGTLELELGDWMDNRR